MENLKTYNAIKTIDGIYKDIFTSEPFKFEWLPEPVLFEEGNKYFYYGVAKRKIKYPYCIYDAVSSPPTDTLYMYYRIPKDEAFTSRIDFEGPTFEVFTLNGYLRKGNKPLFMTTTYRHHNIHTNGNIDAEKQRAIYEIKHPCYTDKFRTLNYYESLEGDHIARNIKTLEWHSNHIVTSAKLDRNILADILLYLKQKYHPEMLNFKDMAWLI